MNRKPMALLSFGGALLFALVLLVGCGGGRGGGGSTGGGGGGASNGGGVGGTGLTPNPPPIFDTDVISGEAPRATGNVTLPDGTTVNAALDQIIVDFTDTATGANVQALTQFLQGQGASVVGQDPFSRAVLVRLAQGAQVSTTLQAVEAQRGVMAAQPNLLSLPADLPSPATFPGDYWFFFKDQAPQAWSSVASRLGQVRVTAKLGIVDSGIDTSLPEFRGGVTVVLDLPGFITGGGPDESGHGTAVAGIASGSWQGGTARSAGVAPDAAILLADVETPNVTPGLWADRAGIVSCVLNGAKVINVSRQVIGGRGQQLYREVMYAAVAAAARRGVLVVIAAGNDSVKNDDQLFGTMFSSRNPAAQQVWRDNVIIVGATDQNDNVASFSRGGRVVDVFAPGDCVGAPRASSFSLSNCRVEGDVAVVSGTSFAAPQVAGTALLMLTSNPGQTPSQLKDRIVNSADTISGIRRLNAVQAVATQAIVSMEGFVRSRGTPVAGAVVSTSLDAQTGTTDSNGHFFLVTRAVGNHSSTPYTITIAAAGFQTFSGTNSWGDSPWHQAFDLSPTTPSAPTGGGGGGPPSTGGGGDGRLSRGPTSSLSGKAIKTPRLTPSSASPRPTPATPRVLPTLRRR